jgi:hypothetical protein
VGGAVGFETACLYGNVVLKVVVQIVIIPGVEFYRHGIHDAPVTQILGGSAECRVVQRLDHKGKAVTTVRQTILSICHKII